MEQLNLFPNKKEREEMAKHPIKEGPNPSKTPMQNPNPGHVKQRYHEGGFEGTKQLGVRYPGHDKRRDNPDATEGSGGGGE